MSLFFRNIKHKLYIALMTFAVKFQPGARHFSFVGRGSSAQLCRHIIQMGYGRVLVVTDKPLRELGVVDCAVATLIESGIDVAYFDGVLPDPTFTQVAEGVAVLKAHGSQAVLGIGGGSSMDAAKIIAAAANSDEDPAAWAGFGKVKHDVLKIFAMPTTSGTGSEATIGAVISDPQTHAKSIISTSTLLPSAVALDPDLLVGLPPPITAATGMDALTHGIEAYIGIWERGSRLEDARAAVKLVFANLARAYGNGGDLDAREGMALGSFYAGIAINQVNVGSVHAIAHQLGAKYGIPHGLANALVLPHVLDYCQQEAGGRLAELAILVGLGSAGDSEEALARKFIQGVRELCAEVGIPQQSDKIQAADHDAIAIAAMAEGDAYPAPRLLEHEATIAILQKITA